MEVNRQGKENARRKTIDELTRKAIGSGFDAAIIGGHLIEPAKYPDGIERAVAYASIVVKAKIARIKAGKGPISPPGT
jgi:hypothetical protein